jgi:hypothetical protein
VVCSACVSCSWLLGGPSGLSSTAYTQWRLPLHRRRGRRLRMRTVSWARAAPALSCSCRGMACSVSPGDGALKISRLRWLTWCTRLPHCMAMWRGECWSDRRALSTMHVCRASTSRRSCLVKLLRTAVQCPRDITSGWKRLFLRHCAATCWGSGCRRRHGPCGPW